MKMAFGIYIIISVCVTFCLWCCMKVGAESDRHLDNRENNGDLADTDKNEEERA